MPLIPLFIQNELESGDGDELISQFNFCNPFDTIFPIADGATSQLDKQHLWGLFTGIATLVIIPRPDSAASMLIGIMPSMIMNIVCKPALEIEVIAKPSLIIEVEIK